MAAVLTTLAQRAVATAGTAVPLVAAPVTNVIRAYLYVPSGNTGNIFLGDANVSSTRGIVITKGTSFVVDAPHGDLLDLGAMYIDAGTNGDKIQVTYLSRV